MSTIVEHSDISMTEQPVHPGSRAGLSSYAQQLQVTDRVPAIVAEQIMTKPVVALGSTATIHEAWELFERRRFRHVPVLGQTGMIRGLLSDRDVLRVVAGIKHHLGENEENPENVLLEHVMTKPVLTAHPETEIRSVARVMFDERIGAMPIVDQDGLLLGMITRNDILRTVMQQVPFELWI